MFKFIFYFIVFISHITNSISSSREKRFLIFPRGNPTRQQFVAGIGIPVDLERESLTIGYVFKAQYFLPYNSTQLRPTKLRLERDVAKDQNMKVDDYGQVYESYDVEAEVKSDVEDDKVDADDDEVRWVIYKGLEYILDGKNIDGKQCVLRAICEASQLHFTHESGLLGEIFHIFFVPSTTHTGDSNDYIFAEFVGKSDENCERVFNRCTFSLLQIFSQIH